MNSGSVSSLRRFQRNAVDRARRYAQFATGAFGSDDGMHELRRTQYRINRTSLQAQSTADAGVFVNDGDGAGSVYAET